MKKNYFYLALYICIMLSMTFNGCVRNDISTVSTDTEHDADTENLSGGNIFQESYQEARTSFMIEGNSTEDTTGKIPIYTLSDLENMDSDGDDILMADIDCKNSEHFVKKFKGTFDGNFHQLLNRTTALFEMIEGGTVKNLAIINTTSNTAGLVNEFDKGVIDNCYVTGEIGKNSDMDAVTGGLVQWVFGSQCYIYNSFNTADIYNITDGRGKNPNHILESSAGGGGIVGSVRYNSYQIEDAFLCSNCENYGTIYGDGRRSIGGICGNIEIGINGPSAVFQVLACTNYGSIIIDEEEETHTNYDPGIGGVVGKISGGSKIENSLAKMDITCCSNYGAFSCEKSTIATAGICGYVDVYTFETAPVTVKISNCLNSCRGIEDMGGICHSIKKSYADIGISSCIDLSGSDRPVYRYNQLPRTVIPIL